MPKDYQVSQYDSPSTSTAGWSCPTAPGGHHPGPHGGGHGKTTHVGRGRPHPRRRPLARRLQPGRRAAGRDRQRARHPLRRAGQGLRERAAGHPRGHRRLRRPDGGGLAARRRQRLRAAGRRDRRSAPGARSRTSTRCGRWAGPSSTRCAARSSCSKAGETVVQETRHWDEDEGRTSSMRSKEEAYDYRYFPEPDLVPLGPTEEWLAAVRAALPALPGRPPAAAGRRRRASPSTTGRGHGRRPGPRRAGAGPRSRPAPTAAWPSTGRPTSWPPPSDAGAVDAAAFAEVLVMEGDGAADRHPGQGGAGRAGRRRRRPGRDRQGQGLRGPGHRRRGRRRRRRHRRPPGGVGPLPGGEAKLAGFFVGKVMAATTGKADGKAVTALLRERRRR